MSKVVESYTILIVEDEEKIAKILITYLKLYPKFKKFVWAKDGVEAMQSMIDRKHFFDFIFIDADKNNYPHYYELSLQLLSPNGIIIIDNMLWHGDVADDKKQDTQTNTIRELNLKIQKDDRINYSLLPLSDGLSFIQKK